MQEHLNFYLDNIHTSSIKRKNTQTCSMIELYILFYKQSVCGMGVSNEKRKRLTWWVFCSIAMCLYHSLTGSKTPSLLFKEKKANWGQEGVSGLSYETLWSP